MEVSSKIKGSLTIKDMVIIEERAREVKENGFIVEIGCYYGKSSSIIFLSKKESVIFYTIDSFTGTEVDKNKEQYEIMIQNMVNFNFYPRIIYSSSQKAYYLFEDKSIDLLFIDGWHLEESVLSDIGNFLPKMKKGSIMMGHDWETYKSVNNAVLHFFNKDRIKTNLQIGSSIWEVLI